MPPVERYYTLSSYPSLFMRHLSHKGPFVNTGALSRANSVSPNPANFGLHYCIHALRAIYFGLNRLMKRSHKGPARQSTTRPQQ